MLTYLPTADRARLDQLKPIIENARLPLEDRKLAEQERDEIEKRRKALHETTYEEAQDFRMYLFGKYRKLAGLGASVQAFQFQTFIGQIEQRLMQLQFEATKKALAEEQTKAQVGKGLRQNGRGVKTRRGPVPPGTAANPWAIPIDDED